MPGFHSGTEMYELEDALVDTVTLKAALVRPAADAPAVWIPRSQIEKVEETKTGKIIDIGRAECGPRVTIRMTAWIAKEKGLI
jgi:hypothetical protein